MDTVLDLLQRNACDTPNNVAIHMPIAKTNITYTDLLSQSLHIADYLRSTHNNKERIILLFDNTIEFFSAFLGCLFAELIPIPLTPPSPHRLEAEFEKILWVCEDSKAQTIFTQRKIKSKMKLATIQLKIKSKHTVLSQKKLPRIITHNDIKNTAALSLPHIDDKNIAFLQYTSGSTNHPKGVMISHRNIMQNTAHIIRQLQNIKSAVTWVPCHHDLGIMSALFMPMYLNIPSFLISPRDFITHPINWLNTVTLAPDCYSAAPNFAYELCCKKITEQERQQLNLSLWRYAGCGAEKNQISTLQKFASTFSQCGFKPSSFSPAYGLAEHTVCVSGFTSNNNPINYAIPLTDIQLKNNDHQLKQQCSLPHGKAFNEHRIIIVDPSSLLPCPDDTVGEIWCQGPSVALGYWNNNTLTQATFNAYTHDNQGPFLRTGDLGFLHHHHLHLTGRIKDLIIIHGKNFAAEDIEWNIQHAHPALRPGSVCAFSISKADHAESAVLLAEVRQHARHHAQDIIDAIQAHALTIMNLRFSTICLLPPGALYKTTSGKIQRQKNKKLLMEHKHSALLSYQHSNKKIEPHQKKSILKKYFLLQRKESI